jgi:hypothetical protein
MCINRILAYGQRCFLTVLARQSPQLADFSQTSLMISYFFLMVLIFYFPQKELISYESHRRS